MPSENPPTQEPLEVNPAAKTQAIDSLIVLSSARIPNVDHRVAAPDQDYRLFVDDAAEGMYRADFEGRMIFANPSLARILGHASSQTLVDDCRQHPFDPYVDPFRREELLRRLKHDGRVVDFESLAQTHDGRVIRISENVRAITGSDGQLVEYQGTMVDVTTKRQAEANLEFRIRLERIITSVSTKFINLDTHNVDAGIRDALALVGMFLEVDRCFIFQASDKQNDWEVTHAWFQEPDKAHLLQTNLPVDSLSWINKHLLRFRPVVANRVSDLPADASVEREYFLARGVQSLIMVPMLHSGSVAGVIGVECDREERSWTDEVRFLLRMVGEISMNALEHKWAEEAIHRSEQKLSVLVQETPLAVVEWDEQFRIKEWNRSAERIFGFTRDEILESVALELFTFDESREEAERNWAALLNGERSNRHTSENIRADGRSIICEWYNTVLYDRSGRVIGGASMAQDVTQRKEAEARLLKEALHDALTGLPNRAHFTDRLQRRLRQIPFRPSSLFAVLFLDLDRFKIINDSLGHLVGDRLLIEISRRLEHCIRSTDIVCRGQGEHTVARLGGDEFTLLLDNLPDEATASKIAQRIQDVVSEPCILNGHKVYTTASIGVAFGGLGYTSADDLLRDADIAMYEAKNNGKARHEVFDTEMRAQAMARLDLEISLRRAVERKEFVVYFQPINELPSGRVQAVEALVRWNHPEFGIVGPDVFISLAEETGLILPIGDWVLEESCRQIKKWQTEIPDHAPKLVCVNLSGSQFKREDLVGKLKRTIEETGLTPGSVGLEITESEIMLNAGPAIRTLNDLRSLGLHLYIDDFGTGYSSLSYLQRFPTSTLKIDRTFVMGMESNQENMEIVRAIISLATNLGKMVVAEGVENKEQVELLQSLGCRLFQGNFFLPASDALSVTRFLEVH